MKTLGKLKLSQKQHLTPELAYDQTFIIANIMAADGIVRQGAKASSAMILT